MTKYCISFIVSPRHMLLSRKVCFSFVRVEVACTILERISRFQKSLSQIFTGIWNLVKFPFLSFYLDLSQDAIVAVSHQFGVQSILLPFYNSQRFCLYFQLGILFLAPPQQKRQCQWLTKIDNSSAAYASLSNISCRASSIILQKNC